MPVNLAISLTATAAIPTRLEALSWIRADEAISGVSTRLSERPQGRRLFDLFRSGDVLVVRWIDRLGRNYEDVCDTIRESMRRGIVIGTVINGMTFDGATKVDLPPGSGGVGVSGGEKIPH